MDFEIELDETGKQIFKEFLTADSRAAALDVLDEHTPDDVGDSATIRAIHATEPADTVAVYPRDNDDTVVITANWENLLGSGTTFEDIKDRADAYQTLEDTLLDIIEDTNFEPVGENPAATDHQFTAQNVPTNTGIGFRMTLQR